MKFVLLIFLLAANLAFGFGRDSREKRQQYTDTLRVFLVQIDKAMSEAEGLKPETRQRLKTMSEDLLPKASPQRKTELSQQMERVIKATPAESEAMLRNLRKLVIETFRVVTVPAQIPDPLVGQLVYKEFCEACHGADGRGNGKLAQNKRFPMQPPPSDLEALAESKTRTPFSIYNLLLVGIEGTSMEAFDSSLKDHDRWSLAFYLLGRPFKANAGAIWDARSVWSALSPQDQEILKKAGGSLDELSGGSDQEIEERLSKLLPNATPEKKAQLMLALRRTLGFFTETPRSAKP